MSLTVFDFNEKGIRFEKRGDRVWVSLTDMAKAAGKKVNDWNRLTSTVEFLKELESVAGFPVTDSVQGGIPQEQGTWAIEEVAIDFASWCNVKFRIWVTQQIKTILSRGKVEQQESRIEVRQQQPQLSIQEAKEVIADFRLNHALAVSTGNVRLQQQMEVAIAQYTDVFLLAGLPQNPLLGGQPAGTPINMRFEGVVDVAIRLGFKIPSGYESSLGNHVGKTLAHLRVSINDERLKDYRFNLASGKRVPAFMYPAFNKEIEASVTEYCTKKGFAQNSKHLASA